MVIMVEMLRLLARLIGQTLNYFFWQATYWIYIKPFQNMYILNNCMKNKAYLLYHCRRAYQSHISPINSSILFSVYGRLFWGNKAQSFNFFKLTYFAFQVYLLTAVSESLGRLCFIMPKHKLLVYSKIKAWKTF